MPKREPKNVETAYGLDIVVQGENPTIDIVAIHGLNGHREKTWRAKNGVNWLRDFVPNVLPNARVLSWGYAARTHGAPSLDKTYLYDHGGTRRPIIFIAHSLGGIILKSALFHAATASPGSHPEHRSIKLSTYGIIFLGTPHQGASGAKLGQVVANVASLFVEADDRLLKRLEPDSEWLQQQQQQYATIGADFVTKLCYEEYPTPTALGHEIMVVPKQSAVVPELAAAETVVIHANHKNMVKYASKEDENFGIVSKMLQSMAQNAASVVLENWEIEARMNAGTVTYKTQSLNMPLT
ncbi:hypothetical protein NLG97_g11025 [Lecanicillium saksenae]|uniref:Uncharacterized protein n=1 Tax=Lecanicillium saksenae TaxID=468837 RepID=A0ACC1QD91_9HYPO|nr:hypothetical protein NLG97_g11025 [Lecanicillium saksenae]